MAAYFEGMIFNSNIFEYSTTYTMGGKFAYAKWTYKVSYSAKAIKWNKLRSYDEKNKTHIICSLFF